MAMFDCECTVCGNVEEQIIGHDEEPAPCESCSGKTVKVISGAHFKLVYDPKRHVCSWGNEGYATSQYWNAVKEARSRGEKVKGCNED
jgi:putative FmdB family regulatory protein